MKILVIGSKGFIGSNCIRHLKNKYVVTGCDIFDHIDPEYIKIDPINPDYNNVFSNKNYEICINASGAASVAASISDPYFDYRLNVDNVVRILESIKKISPKCHFINFSSAAVYGNTIDLPINEGHLINPVSPYGYHKAASELVCKSYSENFNLRISIIRFFSVYGEGLKKQLLWDASNKIFNNDEDAVFFGTGLETRDWLHIDDAVTLIEKVALSKISGFNIYNGGTGISQTNKFVITSIKKYLNIEKKIIFNNTIRAGDPVHYLADIEKAKKLGWKAKIELADGIKRYCSWFKSLY